MGEFQVGQLNEASVHLHFQVLLENYGELFVVKSKRFDPGKMFGMPPSIFTRYFKDPVFLLHKSVATYSLIGVHLSIECPIMGVAEGGATACFR